jgi:hypothetical protein
MYFFINNIFRASKNQDQYEVTRKIDIINQNKNQK